MKGPVPAVMETEAEPLLFPQVACVDDEDKVMPPLSATVTEAVSEQAPP